MSSSAINDEQSLAVDLLAFFWTASGRSCSFWSTSSRRDTRQLPTRLTPEDEELVSDPERSEVDDPEEVACVTSKTNSASCVRTGAITNT